MAIANTIDKVLTALPVAARFATLGSLNNLEGTMETRIFGSGKQGEDANGNVIKGGKPYSESYAEFRRASGKQSEYIDLIFTGNLLRSIKVIEDTQGGKIIFSNADGANKAEDIERKFRQVIFAATTEEANKTFDDFERLFFVALDQELATI